MAARRRAIALVVPVLCGCSIHTTAYCLIPRLSVRRGRTMYMRTAAAGDVAIVGGGLAGLSTALEIAQRGGKVVVLNRNEKQAASLAAGGMLAPQAERLNSEWIEQLESLSGGMPTGFATAGGFLAPAFAGDAVDVWSPPTEAGSAYRLDAEQIRRMEPSLSTEIQGGWWFPEDMQVDARLTYRALREACRRSGVSLLDGPDWDVESIVFHPINPVVQAINLRNGRRLAVSSLVVANGAWMNKLLPVPVYPVKGQMLSLRPVTTQPPLLARVLFADSCYIIPKTDGRLVIGATVEPGLWDDRVTARGLYDLTSRALRLIPVLGDMEVEETWSGLRPTTPDTLPVLGRTPWQNLHVAGGYWRNGVLLAPRTGQLMADVIEGREGVESGIESFAWSRFLPQRTEQETLAQSGKPFVTTRTATESSVHRAASGLAGRRQSAASEQGKSRSSAAAEDLGGANEEYGDELGLQQQGWQIQTSPGPVKEVREAEAEVEGDEILGQGVGKYENDPYADYAKMADEVDREEVLREARRINREGSIAYGLGEDNVGKVVAARWSVPSADVTGGSEWQQLEQAQAEGLRQARELGWTSLRHSEDATADSSQLEEESREGGGIEDLMVSLGYEYVDPRVAKRQLLEERRKEVKGNSAVVALQRGSADHVGPAGSIREAIFPPSPEEPQQEIRGTQQEVEREEEAKETEQSGQAEGQRGGRGKGEEELQEQDPPLPVRGLDDPPPPWAQDIDALYEKVRRNQAAFRKARGEPAQGRVTIPFKSPPEEGQTMSREMKLSKFEMFRANPDGSLTRVERGQGLPPPWEPEPVRVGAPSQYNGTRFGFTPFDS